MLYESATVPCNVADKIMLLLSCTLVFVVPPSGNAFAKKRAKALPMWEPTSGRRINCQAPTSSATTIELAETCEKALPMWEPTLRAANKLPSRASYEFTTICVTEITR
jgi:hypothetical protein